MSNRQAPARVWIEVLRKIAPVLAQSNVSDVILFGSQAMSVYTKRALASKDINLIAPGVTEAILEKTSQQLQQLATQTPSFDHLVSDYAGRRYPVSHIFLKHRSGFPFAIDFFENFLGYPSTRLNPFLNLEQKWGLDLQVLSPEAIIGTRLAFRPPERITATNAARLNRFIKNIGSLDWTVVKKFIDSFDLGPTVTENLSLLKSKHISITGISHIMNRMD